MAAPALETARTFLFVPADRPDRFGKAVAAGADVVIIDLEDAVAPENKVHARAGVARWLAGGRRAAVRINGRTTPWHDDDVAAVSTATAVVVPKAESAEDVAACHDNGAVAIIPLIETPRGLLAAGEICRAPGVVRVAFGNVDFAAELGVDPASHAALAAARSQLVHASAAACCAPPIDGVTTAFNDPESLALDARHARELGFGAKLLIHPAQIKRTAEIFAPSAKDVAWARGVLAAPNSGVGVDNGQMIDDPVRRRARRLLAAAEIT
jgi:citrate lyase subunit beta/citryl-CoA lyase